MKHLLFSIFCFISFVFVTTCNEYDEDDYERPPREYEVVVVTPPDFTELEMVYLTEVLSKNDINTETMLITTNNIVAVACNIEYQLKFKIYSPIMIGFKIEKYNSTDRFAYKIYLNGYSE